MKTKKKKNMKQKETQPDPPKPTINAEHLERFLEGKLTIKGDPKITNIHAGFLWDKFGVERYRIDVWVEELVEGSFCVQKSIALSFFLHYKREKGVIIDKTIERNPINLQNWS